MIQHYCLDMCLYNTQWKTLVPDPEYKLWSPGSHMFSFVLAVGDMRDKGFVLYKYCLRPMASSLGVWTLHWQCPACWDLAIMGSFIPVPWSYNYQSPITLQIITYNHTRIQYKFINCLLCLCSYNCHIHEAMLHLYI